MNPHPNPLPVLGEGTIGRTADQSGFSRWSIHTPFYKSDRFPGAEYVASSMTGLKMPPLGNAKLDQFPLKAGFKAPIQEIIRLYR